MKNLKYRGKGRKTEENKIRLTENKNRKKKENKE
jgi:hypothetical protein